MLKTNIALSSLLTGLVNSAFALEPFTVSTIKFEPGIETGVGFIDNGQQDFGSKTSIYGLTVDQSGQRWEGYIKPSLAFELPMNTVGTLYGKTSAVSSLTRGDSDGLGYTRGDPTDTDWDEAYLGWRSGSTLSWLGTDALSISVGRQPFMIGSGFLIGEGHVDQGHEGAYWLAPRKAFDWSAIATINIGEFHADLFHLKTRMDIDVLDYSENVTVNGINSEWRSPFWGTYGATAFWTRDNESQARNGLQVKDVRGSLAPIKSIPELILAGEYAWQDNSSQNLSAHAWYLETSYTFKNAPWQPILTYRHSMFSEKYDSLLYGYSGDYGYWFQGEVVGESMLFNTNEGVHMLKLTAYPSAELRVGAIGYQFLFNSVPEGVNDRQFAKEFDLYADWMPNAHWAVGALYGIARPDEGAKQFFGDDKTSNLFETYATYKF